MKKWWVRAIVFAVIWTVLVIGAGIVHTDVIRADKLTPEEDEAISLRYGLVCGLGLLVLGAWCWLSRPRSPEPLRDLLRE
jgi:hypothetical protein